MGDELEIRLMLTHSIVVTTKDRPVMLRRAVGSALAALAPGGEVLVVDDHSAVPASVALSDLSDERLRFCVNAERVTGVSATRNTGLTAARGEVVFFLDDDDEFLPGYCAKVLSKGARLGDYGFSSYMESKPGSSGALTRSTVRFAEGLIPRDAPLRRQLCGFGMGFWIRREVALKIGPVSTDLTMNEDTEYLCRLITAGLKGWYSAEPGVVVHSHDAGRSEAYHITKRTSPAERARCMRLLCERYPQMVAHLGSGYIRHCLKSGLVSDAWRFAELQPDWRVRSQLKMVLAARYLGYAMTRRLSVKQAS